MKIIVDAMGGDFAPLAPVKGALMAQEKYGVDIVLTGKTEEILKALQQCGCKELPKGMEIANATEVVEICDDPATAFKHKKDSSLTVGLNMLHAGDADGFVSAGSTGALLAGATLLVKRIRGLRRAALAPTIPTAKGKAVLIDCGANAECTVEYLLQFAYLGSYYAQKVLGVENPRIGLLNIGAEESKGDTLRRETYQKLKEAGEAGHLNFTGNIEAKEAMLGECDVIVADGYSGNIMLKSIEGTGKLLSIKLKEMLMHSTGTKLAALLLKSTVFKGEAVPFVMELPNYRLPGLKNVAQLLWEKARDFLQKAFTVIFAATIVIWFLQNFDLQLRLTADPQASILARIAGDIAPLFAPLGFADWRISTALISGFMAKESVVSSLLVLFGSTAALTTALTPAQAAPLLVFCLLYTPCIAAVASVKRELGGKWATIMVVNQCAVAWLCALLVRLVAVAVF